MSAVEIQPEALEMEMAVDRDLRRIIEHIQIEFDSLREQENVTNKTLAIKAGMDPSYLSRVLSGRCNNITVKSVARIFRAMNMRVEISSKLLTDLTYKCPNHSPAIEYDHAVYAVSFHRSATPFNDKKTTDWVLRPVTSRKAAYQQDSKV